MNEMDLANKQLDDLKEQGYRSIYQKQRQKQYEQAQAEYEYKLNCPEN